MANFYIKGKKYIQTIKLLGLTNEEELDLGLEPVLKNRWDCQNYIFLQYENEDGTTTHNHTCSQKRAQIYESKVWKIVMELNEEPIGGYLIEDISELL